MILICQIICADPIPSDFGNVDTDQAFDIFRAVNGRGVECSIRSFPESSEADVVKVSTDGSPDHIAEINEVVKQIAPDARVNVQSDHLVIR